MQYPWAVRAACVVVLILGMAAPARRPAESCSIFSLSRGDQAVYGQNLDWHAHFPGLVVVNKRGVNKAILPWKGSWPNPADKASMTWRSRYGSVTFTCYGRDFIEGGMNEAGLTVDETNLTALYPKPDGRPGVSCAQWMQYQLDNFATVDELLEHLNDLRPDGEGWHYLISDRGGDCAIIEYPAGVAKVYSGDEVEVCALTNTGYEQALSHLRMDKAFGGGIDIASGADSYGRFVRMAALLRDFNPEGHGPAADYAFKILDEVSCDDTIRSVVYDAGGRRVLWRTPENPSIRWLDLASLDFSLETPTQVMGVDGPGSGDVSSSLEDYTLDANLKVLLGVLGPDREDEDVMKRLESRGLTFDRALNMIAVHPTALHADCRGETKTKPGDE